MASANKPKTLDPVRELAGVVRDAAHALAADATVSGARLERPPKREFGDYSSNAPMLLAPILGAPPREVAARLGTLVHERLGDMLDRAEVAGPGFLNLFLDDRWFRRALADALAAGERYGRAEPAVRERILVEFVSANPTGPPNAATGRHAAYGDSLCRILELAGHDVEREYYVNDHGSQVRRFGASILARAEGREPPPDGYTGGYVAELADEIPQAAQLGVDELALRGVELMVERMRATLERFRVRFDRFYYERSLHDGAIDRALELIEARGHVYQSDGAMWLRTSVLGDDKDRVLRRSSGELTYFAADIAYHEDKRQRGVDRVINIWGADHHGYVPRMQAAWQALGGERDRLEVLIMQLVNLVESGQRVQMSKRAGEFVTLDDLIDDIGVDAARFFLLGRSHDTTLDLDLALARDQSQENPVYYVQYAHARIASILRRVGERRVEQALASDLADAPEQLHPSARALVTRLLELPAEIALAAQRRAPHRLTAYVHETAQLFSAFYRDCRVVGAAEEGGSEEFRIAVCVQAKRVIARSLDLLGVIAPERM